MNELNFLQTINWRDFKLYCHREPKLTDRWFAHIMLADLREGDAGGDTPEEALRALELKIQSGDLKVDYTGY